MAGTKSGGKLAAKTNRRIHGADFYKRIGSMGGKKGKTGGFYALVCNGCSWSQNQHRKAECAGAKGGTISRRSK